MSLESFFVPSGIAVIGASADPVKLGYAVARNLVQIGYPGALHYVNNKGGMLFNRPMLTSIDQIPDPVDLAVVIVPSQAAPQTLRELGQRGIKSAILASGGFRETGPEGTALEAEVLSVCHEYGIRLVGPNCIGLMDTHHHLDTTFLQTPPPAPGSVAFISHSGALCQVVIDWARQQGVGFSRIASLGNQADLTETDLLPLLAADPNTRAIMLYLESIPDGQKFIETAHKISAYKPIIALKSGRNASGQRAAASHTGALAGTDAAVTAAFEKAGVVRAISIENLLEWSRALAACPLPTGRRVAILTAAGGPGVVTADALSDFGLILAELSPATIETLHSVLPPIAGFHNPVDMLASASPATFADCLRILLEDPGVDSVILLLVPPPMHSAAGVAKAIIPLIRSAGKPALVTLLAYNDVETTARMFIEAGIPTFPFAERAVSALSRLSERAEFLGELKAGLPDQAPVRPPKMGFVSNLGADDSSDPAFASRLMDTCGIPAAELVLARDADEAKNLAGKLGFPLVAKIASPDILHKSDIGGVLLDLESIKAVEQAFATLTERARQARPNARIAGITLQRQVAGGQEVIIGSVRDPRFGALMMFGFGGVDVEGFKDVTFALAPLTPSEAEKMINRTWAGRKLDGFRSIPPSDKSAVVEALVRLSWLAHDHPEFAEIEINPLLVLNEGVVAVDVRISVGAE